MIDPVSAAALGTSTGNVISFVGGHLAGKGVDLLQEQIHRHVIEPFRRRRTDAFLKQFYSEVVTETPEGNLDDVNSKVESILKDQQKAELLFDACRQVMLSKSREMGPRIIAVLAARIIGNGRIATEDEETMLIACERMSDSELLGFAKFVRNALTDGPQKFREWGITQLVWKATLHASHWRSDSADTTCPIRDKLGTWALAAQSIGLVTLQSHQEIELKDANRVDVEAEFRCKLYQFVEVRSEIHCLADLVERFSHLAKPSTASCS